MPPAELRPSDDLQTAGDRPRPLVQLMQAARNEPGIKKVFVASGIRMDLARPSPEYMRDWRRITSAVI